MRRNGFTLVEILVILAIIGIIAAIAIKIANPTPEAKVIACHAELEAMNTLVEQAAMQVFPRDPTWEEVQQIAENRWDDHYHFLLNNSDANKGHGNDMDQCDEENPGKSSQNRDCLNLRYVIFCDHDHYLADIEYNMLIASMRLPADPIAVPLDVIDGTGWGSKGKGKGKKNNPNPKLIQRGNGHEYLRDLWYWRGKDPNWQRWADKSKK